jgi:hypothetical protein
VTDPPLSPYYLRLAALAVLVTAGFGLTILYLGPGETALHELAGGLLLILLLGTVVLAVRGRSAAPGALPRALGALALLVVTGSAGAALALGALPGQDEYVPGVLLLGLVLLVLEMVRYALRIHRASAGPTPRERRT